MAISCLAVHALQAQSLCHSAIWQHQHSPAAPEGVAAAAALASVSSWLICTLMALAGLHRLLLRTCLGSCASRSPQAPTALSRPWWWNLTLPSSIMLVCHSMHSAFHPRARGKVNCTKPDHLYGSEATTGMYELGDAGMHSRCSAHATTALIITMLLSMSSAHASAT